MITLWTIQFLLFIACLIGSAFFAATETALTSISLSSWDRLRRDHPHLSTAYAFWSANPSLVLATLLFGNMVTGLGTAVLTSALLRPIDERLELPTGVFVLICSAFAGTFLLLTGEILPKLYARHYHEKVMVWTGLPLGWTVRILSPMLRSFSAISDMLRRLFSHRAREPLITREELRQALHESPTESVVPSAKRMLSNIMTFDQIKVREVMIPRNHIVAVRMEQNTERVFEHIVRSGFSRIPIYFGNIDNILGVVYAKDLLTEWRSSGLLVLEDLLRPPYRIAPDAPLPTLLQAFRQGHHLAIVTDALGRTEGIVTIEDVVEAIVGDIADEFDQRDS